MANKPINKKGDPQAADVDHYPEPIKVLVREWHAIKAAPISFILCLIVVGAVFLVKEVQQPAVLENNCEDGIACLTQEEIYQYMNANSHEFDVQQIQETVEPTLDTITVDYTIEKQDATQYIEENKLILEFDESSTDIF